MESNYIPKAVLDSIIREEAGTAYTFVGNDKNILKQMCDEINRTFSDYKYNFRYLTEISMFGPSVGASSIYLKYIYQFESESCRAVLVSRILADKVKIKDLDRIVMDLYHHFRASPYYISPPGSESSAHIYVTYDNAFKRLKSPKLVPELVDLMKSRRDVFILGVTARMIAKKWAPAELGQIMANHLINKNVTMADVGLTEEGEYYPPLTYIVEQTSFNAINCLQFYPSENNLRIIMDYMDHPNRELAKFAQKHAEIMKKKLLETQSTK
ncbi:MAG: hypothetical protein IJN63_09620 [Clostridia bacterium]|nr:hypothetical protein [Clostridia bacterium]